MARSAASRSKSAAGCSARSPTVYDFLEALFAAQYAFIRAETVFRCARVHDRVPRRGTGDGFAGSGGLVGAARLTTFFAFDGLCALFGKAARGRSAAGPNSMPNIPDRSSVASTFPLAGPLRAFERSDPALAIKSC
jgi:hypothetical protein